LRGGPDAVDRWDRSGWTTRGRNPNEGSNPMPKQPGDKRETKVPFSLSIFGAIGMVALVVVIFYMGSRLETIEDRLSFRPPQSVAGAPASAPTTSTGRAVYVPAYSHIYSRGGQPLLLEVTLSVRNTDPELPVRIERVRYYDTQGRLIRELADAPLTLAPLQTASYLVEKRDIEGGSGANFIVEWSADEAVNPPIFEAVMIGVDNAQSVSFTSRAQPIARAAP
jgi:hypothetical protein